MNGNRFCFLMRLGLPALVLAGGLAAGPVGAEPKSYELPDAAQALNLPPVVAVVNGVEISSDHVKFEFNRLMRDIPKKLKPKDQSLIARGIVDNEIVRELVFQQAKTEGIEVQADELDETLAGLKKGYSGDDEWQAALKARGIEESAIRHSIQVDLMARKLLENQVRGKIKITDAQVENFYKENQDRFQRPESYRAQHIFIAYIPAQKRGALPPEELMKQADALREDARKRIGAIQEQLQNGGKFEELAKQHSEDAGSAARGGDLDFIYKGVFDPAIDEAVSKLKPGETSGIVESAFGYHIIRLNEVRPAELAPFEEVKESIQQHLFTTEAKKLISHYINLLRKKASIEIRYNP